MSDLTKEKRDLKIKAGSVKRLWKEHTLYRNEEQEHRVKLDKIKADGETATDDYDWKVKNTENMMKESGKMVLDTQTRLSAAVAELRQLVVHAKIHPDQFQDSEELHVAEAALNESNI